VTRRVDVTGIDVLATLRPIAYMRHDPTVHLVEGQLVRATITPDGPGTIEVRWRSGSASLEVWGPGGDWLDAHAESLLGVRDDIDGFAPTDDRIAAMWKRQRGLRMTATHTLWHDLAWLIPGQRVTTQDAARSWAAMVRTFGEPAPGPHGLRLPPSPDRIAAAAYHELHPCGIERQRAQNLRAAAKAMPALMERTWADTTELRAALERIPGVGPWTATNVATTTYGDPDEVVLGDYGIPSSITWALAGRRVGTDAEMLELLEPHRPHRWRVARLIMRASPRPPRHGHRRRNPRIADL
jgi:3-methyladenine DNA glycosylase/8-oxoguanine DNA glycosylase